MKNGTTCLYPDCNALPFARGLCGTHYQAAFRLVKAGDTTWEKLERQGKAEAPRVRGKDLAKAAWFLGKKVTAK